MKERYLKPEVSVGNKVLLTPTEASAISNIGVNSIYKLMREPGCEKFVFRVGRKKLVKREAFIAYLNRESGKPINETEEREVIECGYEKL